MNGVDQVVDDSRALFFSDISEMSISCRCVGIGVSEKSLNVAKT